MSAIYFEMYQRWINGLEQNFSTLAVFWGVSLFCFFCSFCCGGLSYTLDVGWYRMFSSIPGFYPLDATSDPLSSYYNPKKSPDIGKGPLGDKTRVENH